MNKERKHLLSVKLKHTYLQGGGGANVSKGCWLDLTLVCFFESNFLQVSYVWA